MLDLQGSFNKQLPGCGHSLSDTNMNYLVFSKEFRSSIRSANTGTFVLLHCFNWDGIFLPKIVHTLTFAALEAAHSFPVLLVYLFMDFLQFCKIVHPTDMFSKFKDVLKHLSECYAILHDHTFPVKS